jgi:6-phospho-3-hexuloisomerase
MTKARQALLGQIATVLDRVDATEEEKAVALIAGARRIALYGVGREGLQIKGFAMRLYHLGLKVSMVGDMTATPVGTDDLLIVSAGPGPFSTVEALVGVARSAGTKVLLLTAVPGWADKTADQQLVVPAPIFRDNNSPDAANIPMGGTIYEGALYVLFEDLIVQIRDRLGITIDDMRANHTNLE